MMGREEKEKKDTAEAQKALEFLFIGFLYILFCYWSGQSLLKYIQEPTSTTIKGSFGNNNMKFPVVTFCDREFNDYSVILNEECDLNLTFGINPHAGLSCLGCGCYYNSMWDCKPKEVYIGEKIYHNLLEKCLERNLSLDLIDLFEKLKSHQVHDFINMTHLINGSGDFALKEKDLQWSSIFHPVHGYCHSFELKKRIDIETKLLFEIEARNMIVYFHSKDDLADRSDINIQFRKHFGGDITHIKVTLEKKSISLPSRSQTPCLNDHHFTCSDMKLNTQLTNEYGCYAPLLYSGHHLNDVVKKQFPFCNTSAMHQVIIKSI